MFRKYTVKKSPSHSYLLVTQFFPQWPPVLLMSSYRDNGHTSGWDRGEGKDKNKDKDKKIKI